MSADLIKRLRGEAEAIDKGGPLWTGETSADLLRAADALAAKDAALSDAADRIDVLKETVDSYSQVISAKQRQVDAAEAAISEMRAELERARKALATADEAISEYIRYLDGGEMRGSYDGKPERDQLRKAGYAVRAARAASQDEGEER